MMKYIFILSSFLFLSHFGYSQNDKEIEIETWYHIKIPTRDGINLSAIITKPKEIKDKLPALFMLTPYMADRNHESACYFAHQGFVVVTVDTRGRGNSDGKADPFNIIDGKDGFDVCKWITQQIWNNGKIGMYGGSYVGMTQWQTLKEMPPGLKTIVPTASVAPGIDFPKRNNIFYTYLGPYLVYISGRTGNMNSFTDIDYWKPIYMKFFAGGLPYSKLIETSGIGCDYFYNWLKHPLYDDFWKKTIPQADDYSKFNIPVLTITGYYDDDQIGAMNYYYNFINYSKSRDEHYLVIGPWDHAGTRKPQSELGELRFDKNCIININKLHLEWFNWILKDGSKPEFLKDKVTYYVMGANKWESTSSIANLNQSLMVLYPSSNTNNANDIYHCGDLLTDYAYDEFPDTFIYNPLDVSFSTYDLEECQLINYSLYKNRECYKGNQLIFQSKQIDRILTIAGQIKFTAYISMDIPDADFEILLYEVKPTGEEIYLTTDILRARFRNGLEKEELCTPGQIYKYEFKTPYLFVRQLSKGSRIRLILRNLNSPHYQKNFQSGGIISEETAKNSKTGIFKFYHNAKYSSQLEIPLLRLE